VTGDADDGLSIGEVAARTGVAVPTLRMWEARHGFPEPQRLANGRRRYSLRDCELVARIQHDRDAGHSLAVAMERARRAAEPPEASIFGGLRRRWSGLAVHRLSKPAMLAVSRAIEDECLARAERGVVLGAFQQQRHYLGARDRWVELARTAELAVVFADFGGRRDLRRRPVELHLDASAVLRREWAVVCDAPTGAACLAGWELPGRPARPDAKRRFEATWSTDPLVVRDAARIGLALAATEAPGLAARGEELVADVPARGDVSDHTISLANRIVAYLDAARDGVDR
jgi:DNA-binding transcriptional MerR regulator